MQILDPRTEIEQDARAAQRLSELSGQRLVAVWNGRRPGPSRELLEGVLSNLDEQHGLASWEVIRKPFVGNAAPDELLNEVMAKADGAITGLGD